MSENHREPEVPDAEVPAVERLDGLARITLEELAITHFVKNGTPPECLYYKTNEWLLAEELKHAETDPTCKIHESRCTSC